MFANRKQSYSYEYHPQHKVSCHQMVIGTQNTTPVRALSAHIKEPKAQRTEGDLLKLTEWVNSEKERVQALKARRQEGKAAVRSWASHPTFLSLFSHLQNKSTIYFCRVATRIKRYCPLDKTTNLQEIQKTEEHIKHTTKTQWAKFLQEKTIQLLQQKREGEKKVNLQIKKKRLKRHNNQG